MNHSKVLGTVGLLSLLAVSGFGADLAAQSQLLIGGQRANYGVVSLAPGFMPDPNVTMVTSGGSLRASQAGAPGNCAGYVTAAPDKILRLTGTSPNLQVRVVCPNARALTPSDTTLVINTASGGWRCADDTNGANPSINLDGATAGQYDIWVGSYQAGARATCRLEISEIRR
jgi:hypothetical protein